MRKPIENITVYGLSGRSGTGKSYQAMNVCRRMDIESIIDDGLFICHNKIEAGHSAKRDSNKITAIRTAIFDDTAERRLVSDRIREVAPASILVIGTSDAMVEKICSRLGLPEPTEIMHIEDVSDSDDITTALRQRREKGKHVIPVPTVEIQPQFSGYFLAPFRFFLRRNGRIVSGDEKSVVRPTYSYLGRYYISNSAVRQIIQYAGLHSPGVSEVQRSSVRVGPEGAVISVAAVFYMTRNLRANVEKMQKHIADEVTKMTSFNILSVNVTVRGLNPETKNERSSTGKKQRDSK